MTLNILAGKKVQTRPTLSDKYGVIITIRGYNPMEKVTIKATKNAARFIISCFFAVILASCSKPSTEDESQPQQTSVAEEKAMVSYSIGKTDLVRQIYPDVNWLPEPYQKSYTTLSDTVTFYTESSLKNDHINFDSVSTRIDQAKGEVIVEVLSNDPAASNYAVMHPAFIENYAQALIGINQCKAEENCWNKNNENPNEPWAFFPQFGMAMANQKSVLLLNYPPASALVNKSYLETFTMKRWARILQGAGVSQPTLFEVIVDVRPIAAPASNTSQNLPDSQTYFNDPDSKTGGYYITPQLKLMLDPPSNLSKTDTLPLVVLGGPAREAWSAITGLSSEVLSTGRYQLAGSQKTTAFILGNHPTVATYQCCENSKKEVCTSFDLIKDEEIDFQVNCWANSMVSNAGQDPKAVLERCRNQWVENLSTANALTLCTSAMMDNNSCYPNNYKEPQVRSLCQMNSSNACPATGATCPSTN
jgi:hypothetical protein